eukprot:7096970-Prymnesium_polylepis.1
MEREARQGRAGATCDASRARRLLRLSLHVPPLAARGSAGRSTCGDGDAGAVWRRRATAPELACAPRLCRPVGRHDAVAAQAQARDPVSCLLYTSPSPRDAHES